MKQKITLLIGLLLLCSFSVFAALSETGDTQLVITSTAPSVDTIELNDVSTGDEVMDLTAASVTTLTCAGTATDADGNADINGVSAVIYNTASSSAVSADNDDNHYTNASCAYVTGSGAYTCTFATVEFYAEPGQWACKVTVTDYSSASDNANDTASINSLLAIDIPDATVINFGNVAVGQASSEKSVNFENEGNVAIDVDVDVYRASSDTDDTNSMNCSVGNIPAANIEASLTSGSDFVSMAASGLTTLDASLAKATGNDQDPTDADTYWKVTVPNSGVAGSCAGKVIFEAVSS